MEICAGCPRYRNWMRLVSWVRRSVRRRSHRKVIFFSSFRDFFGKSLKCVALLGFECNVNPQNLMKIIRAIFEKMKIKNFFLMWTTLNFGVDRKWKDELKLFAGDPRYPLWTRSASWFRRYVRRRTVGPNALIVGRNYFIGFLKGKWW